MLKHNKKGFMYEAGNGDKFMIAKITRWLGLSTHYEVKDGGRIYTFDTLEDVMNAMADYEQHIPRMDRAKTRLFDLQEQLIQAREEIEYWKFKYQVSVEQFDDYLEVEGA